MTQVREKATSLFIDSTQTTGTTAVISKLTNLVSLTFTCNLKKHTIILLLFVVFAAFDFSLNFCIVYHLIVFKDIFLNILILFIVVIFALLTNVGGKSSVRRITLVLSTKIKPI